MKKQIHKIALLLVFILTIFACSNNNDVDSTPPGILANVTVTPINGGGIINYTLPEDDDILYVKAVYTNSLGEEVFRVASKHNNFLEVNGLNQSTPVNVKLYVIDLNENVSNVVEVNFTPLKSFIFLVQ
ncbi:MAG: DUF4959 domain-containing protein, partial [Polaribacter sp.]